MGIWEQKMQAMMAMPEEERMQHMKKLGGMCICRDCPTYKSTGEIKVLFCGVGRSEVVTEEKGCTCGGCPVTPEMGLTKLYYCTKRNKAQQGGVYM